MLKLNKIYEEYSKKTEDFIEHVGGGRQDAQ